MRTLAIETATVACAIAVRDDDDTVERVLDVTRRHTEALSPGIIALLAERHLPVSSLERIVVDRGPGLFTGLRVGIATAQAMSRALAIELVAVTSLEVLAHQALLHGYQGRLSALVDARRGEVFVQNFSLDGTIVALDEPRVDRVGELIARSNLAPQLIGDGAARYRELLSEYVVIDETVPSPLAALSLSRDRPGAPMVTPLYLREADAVANFAVRERGA
jgi:tRNA threonylcarbamoyl adenosine modification protein YeaZ